MPWTRRLPSGLWASTVRTPGGDRITESHELREVIHTWALDIERDIRRGEFVDPRKGEITMSAWWVESEDARGHREKASRRREASVWRNHVEPYWGARQLSSILKPDINKWVTYMLRKGVGAHTIHASLSLLSSLLEAAVDGERIKYNHARGVKRPPLPQHMDRVLDADEEQLLLARMDELFPGRADARMFVELMLDSGCGWEEAAAIPRNAWDLKKGRFRVIQVIEAGGTIRRYGKRDARNRWCQVSPALFKGLKPVILRTAHDGLIFTSPEGAQLHYSNWLRRVWKPGLCRVEIGVNPPGKSGPKPKILVPYLADPQPTPHDCRHTYGTRLADAGVPEKDIAELMGHADRRSTKRYLHAGDDRFEKAQQALARARARAG